MPRKKKQEIVSFKVDAGLAEVLRSIPNRSEFIRTVLQEALEKSCPLCMGNGILTPEQRKHWSSFVANHSIEKCNQCNAIHLVCGAGPKKPVH